VDAASTEDLQIAALERLAIQEEPKSEGRRQFAFQQAQDQGWPVLDPLALHGLAGDVVRKLEPHTESDPAALLFQMLCAFGNAAGRNAYFQIEADQHYANLFVVLVGVSSKGRKGTSKSQILSLFRSADDMWTKECVQGGLSSGEGLIWAVRDPIVDESTPELKVTDEGAKDKRLILFESEFASTLRVLGRDGNTLSAVIRNAWDSGMLRSLTKNSPARATDAHISIVGHITTDELHRYLDSTETANGFANRFLWTSVRRSKLLPEGGSMSDVDFRGEIHRLRKALDFARHAARGRIQFDPEARQLWHSVYPELSEGRPGLLGAVTSRAEPQVLRVALVYALLDCSRQLLRSHLMAGLALWKYADDSARYIFGDNLGDPVADEILAALRNNPKGLSRTQISELFSRNRRAAQISRALSLLLRGGKVRSEAIETRGRSVEMWFAT
jgi:hypothetical protein